jgi:hypothetical protein
VDTLTLTTPNTEGPAVRHAQQLLAKTSSATARNVHHSVRLATPPESALPI